MCTKLLNDRLEYVLEMKHKAEANRDRIDTIMYWCTEYVRVNNEIERIEHEQ